mmetsp:Transcript_4469/g.19055  ORF Transcript_4469/g.19055 Transcript_4469/m.19055 type:complete len:421 (+) Transcript_4469:1568-2830(+)
MRANMPLPLKDKVLHTTEASSKMASFTRSRSSARSNFFSETFTVLSSVSSSSLPTRSRTKVSMETFSTPLCAFTPTRTKVGEYAFPSGPSKPLCMIRITISSSAALEGAHTKTFVRREALSPTISGVSGRWNEYVVSVGSFCVASGGASRGFKQPRIHGDTALWFLATVSLSALRRGASSRRNKNFFRSSSWPNRAFALPGDACRIADNSDNTMRVLPVPGGPWMSVMGCFSSAAETARSCDSLYFRFIAAARGSGSSHGACSSTMSPPPPGFEPRVSTLPPRMACANGSEGNALSANHSRAMVDMLARCVRYHALFGDAKAFLTARNRTKSSVDLPSCGLFSFSLTSLPRLPPGGFFVETVSRVAGVSTAERTADDGSGRKKRTRIMFLLSRPSTYPSAWTLCRPSGSPCWSSTEVEGG